MELLLAATLNCADSQELIEKVMLKSHNSVLYKHELIEVIKTNTEPGCYEGSESST